jgi:hypothetical protein
MEGDERGLGKVVYSVDNVDRSENDNAETEPPVVTEASEESFPASDPPGFAKGNAEHMTGPEAKG